MRLIRTPSKTDAVGPDGTDRPGRPGEEITRPVPREEVDQAAIDAWHAAWRGLRLEDKRIALNRDFRKSVEGVLKSFLRPDHPRGRPALDHPEALNREPDDQSFRECAAMLCARIETNPFLGHQDYAAWILEVFSTLRYQPEDTEEEKTRRSCWFRFIYELCKCQFDASYGHFLDVMKALDYEAKHSRQHEFDWPLPGWEPATSESTTRKDT